MMPGRYHLFPFRTQQLSVHRPRVLRWRRRGRLGSCRNHSSIAQSVERLTVNQNVTGSSPVRGAILYFSGVAALDSWGIAKSVKARDFDSRIRWFESNYPSQIIPFFGGLRGADKGSLAQLVEHLTFNQRVPGSSPG